jgi:hypothetical protein
MSKGLADGWDSDTTPCGAQIRNTQSQSQRDLLERRGRKAKLVIAAVYIARKLYGFSMLQAKTMVDGLTNEQQPT